MTLRLQAGQSLLNLRRHFIQSSSSLDSTLLLLGPPKFLFSTEAQQTAEGGENQTQQQHNKNGQYEKIQADQEPPRSNDPTRVLEASLQYVLKLGWSEAAMVAGARQVGISPSIVGAYHRKEAALVEYFMDKCFRRLVEKIESEEKLSDLIVSERILKLVRTRLEMQVPYISKWPQALSIQAQPQNIPTSFKQRAMLVDEIWHAAGDNSSDMDWYLKRTALGGVYSASEIYMITDHSPDFRDTWSFLDTRVRDALDLQKSVKEASYLAEAVGAGLGNTFGGFMKNMLRR